MTPKRRVPKSDKPAAPASKDAAPKTQQSLSGVENRIQIMIDQLRAHGMKVTPQRIALVRELAKDPTHPTAQELFDRLKPTLPTMSFATVYNTLDALTSAGLCAALSLSPGPARFDPNMEAHHHAVCDRCGLVRDVPLDAASIKNPRAHEENKMPKGDAVELPGFSVRSVEKIFRGLCSRCTAQAARKRKKSPPAKTSTRSKQLDLAARPIPR